MKHQIIAFLIDDDPDDQEIFSFVMKDISPDIRCVFANDGLQALEKLNDPDFTPHVIFIDINMPRMNGIEFLAELKKQMPSLNIPIIMYSTSDENGIVAECLNLGATRFIKKLSDTELVRKEFEKIVTTLH